jgi:hypothetical protein
VDGKPIKLVFVFTLSVGVKYFWMDLNGRHVFAPTPSVGVVHIFVYMILILRACQISHKGQQNVGYQY